ncbi:hypothetical protein HOE31_01275 [bacterium]|jgi:hypothetical protein|nr:hypothetical protein [bacterium]MBT4121561.1 hypothetical protein [bacterium]MBT4335608.1 hypothetical protein [bacterium]MBT4495820.1 hypothetical protein [bacterium]MBT4763697.1 hypothetical protein [bacterium]
MNGAIKLKAAKEIFDWMIKHIKDQELSEQFQIRKDLDNGGPSSLNTIKDNWTKIREEITTKVPENHSPEKNDWIYHVLKVVVAKLQRSDTILMLYYKELLYTIIIDDLMNLLSKFKGYLVPTINSDPTIEELIEEIKNLTPTGIKHIKQYMKTYEIARTIKHIIS